MNGQIITQESELASIAEGIIGYEATSQGVALDFAAFVENRLRYVSEDRRWVAFNGRCWDRANAETIAERLWDDYIGQRIRSTAQRSGAERVAAFEEVCRLSNLRTRREVLQLAQPKLAVSREAFDRRANHLLVTPSGTVDLRTGELGPNDPSRMLTQCTAVPYDPQAADPVHFDELVRKLGGDDEETRLWLWLAIGYTLTGDVREDAVFYLRGPGGNGKSTLIKTLFAILGSYAAKLEIRVLTAGAEHHATELTVVQGARFVVSSEIEKGMKLRESVLKDLSGGEVQAPRDIQQRARDAAKWVPACKVWLYGNHDLVVKDTSESIWRRLNKIESSHRFPQSGLRDALAEQEGAGILKWAVEAAVEWYAHGLGNQPTRVRQATEDYRREQDTLGQYFADRVAFESGAFVAGIALRRDYELWCTERGYEHRIGPKDFEARLREHGCKATRAPKTHNQTRGWSGVRLLAG